MGILDFGLGGIFGDKQSWSRLCAVFIDVLYVFHTEDETTEEESSLAGDDMDKPNSGAVDTDPASATDSTQGTEAKGEEKSATEQGRYQIQ